METFIENLISRLTLEEKISMLHGAGLFRTASVERLGIPAFHYSDGTMGVRGEYPDDSWIYKNLNDDFVTYLPCASALTSTWSTDLAYEQGLVLGRETRGRGKDMILAPGINIKRNPLCGRNFEYMSEDPYLTATMVAPLVRGIQENDVAACVKHFAANSQETDRLSVDSVVDEKTLQEVYFPGFKAAVDAGCQGVMGAYNRLNGQFCCTSQDLLDEVLRRQWSFDGMVVSDWGGVHDTMEAVNASLDVEMDVHTNFSDHFMAGPLLEAVRSGRLQEETVDSKVRNILRVMYRLKMIGPQREQRKTGSYGIGLHAAAAEEIAENSIVLLKNEEKLLPLSSKVRKVAVIGVNAIRLHALGGGSAEIRALYEITPLMGIKRFLGGNTRVDFAPGYHVPDHGGRSEISWQADSTKEQGRTPVLETPEEVRVAYLQEAVALAGDADTVIYVGGLDHMYDVEGLDRETMKLPYGQDALIEALLAVRSDTILTFVGGSPVEMPWLDKAKAVVWMYYNGMEGGSALAKALFGQLTPNGRLAETFLQNARQCPAEISPNGRCEFAEGAMVGYRYHDAHEIPVNFPFGHGLSYTEFTYSDLKIRGRKLSFTLTNVGDREGYEVAQLYIHNGSYHYLRAFRRVFLKPWQKKRITFTLQDADFSQYDKLKKAFAPVQGEYTIEVGASSRDIRLKTNITI